jgi:hypothetical protein
MGASVLIGFATKWASLYHCDETGLDLEISTPSVDLKAGKYLVRGGG